MAGDVAGKERRLYPQNLQPIVREKELTGDAIERQNLVDKSVVHPTRRGDVELQVRLLPGAQLHDAVGRDVRDAMEPIRHDLPLKFRIDPHDHLTRAERGDDIVDADFALARIVAEGARCRRLRRA